MYGISKWLFTNPSCHVSFVSSMISKLQILSNKPVHKRPEIELAAQVQWIDQRKEYKFGAIGDDGNRLISRQNDRGIKKDNFYFININIQISLHVSQLITRVLKLISSNFKIYKTLNMWLKEKKKLKYDLQPDAEEFG
jgi:hypothetical protein